jgi:formylglycine-generating enzyme required for sulfatase activity
MNFDLLKCIGRGVVKYGLKALAEGVPLGNVFLDMAGDAMTAWHKRKAPAERRAEVAALAQAPADEIRRQAALAVQELAAGQPESVRQALLAYLLQVPATVRRSLRRPGDPTGRTVPAALVLETPEDLLPLFPPRLPRFKPGDRPLPGVDWELVELLGVGGFGEVWKARNPLFDGVPPVALKFCLDPAARDRLLRHEAKVLNQVLRQGRHPGIVALERTYLSADPPCLEYEYVAGGDLAGLIQDGQQSKGLPPANALQVIQRLAEPVAFAHRLTPPVVHRDLKPANILVQRSTDAKLSFKIADFGIGDVVARQALADVARGAGSRSQFLTTALRGSHTPLYASPQQKRGEDADPRDDIYALGVIWYQLLTGDLGAEAPSGRVWPRRLQERGASEAMVDLLAACLEPQAGDRPADAAVLAARLAALAPPDTRLPRQLTGAAGMALVLVPAGKFLMGSPATDPDRSADEEPQHEVQITQPFYLGKYAVTRGQFRQFVEATGYRTEAERDGKGGGGYDAERKKFYHPSARRNWLNTGFEQTDEHPVVNVSWNDAGAFCAWLTQKDGHEYRLPTEAEWEYCCRANTRTRFHSGEDEDSLRRVANVADRSLKGKWDYLNLGDKAYQKQIVAWFERVSWDDGYPFTAPVGKFDANAFGLCDLHGNVWEWCQDWYDANYYKASPACDPQGPAAGSFRVIRGGSFISMPRNCRAAYRCGYDPTSRYYYLGFRVLRVR